jgi:hypothetical protein
MSLQEIAEIPGGVTDAENFAYACAQCNRFKGRDIATFDPQTGQIVSLFHSRTQQWADHFRHDGAVIMALSAQVRATEKLLQLNQIDRVLLRRELLHPGRYPYRFRAEQESTEDG